MSDFQDFDVGSSDVGSSDVGSSDVGNCDVGNSDVSNCDASNSDPGSSDVMPALLFSMLAQEQPTEQAGRVNSSDSPAPTRAPAITDNTSRWEPLIVCVAGIAFVASLLLIANW